MSLWRVRRLSCRRVHLALFWAAFLARSQAVNLTLRLIPDASPFEGLVDVRRGNGTVSICGDGLGAREASAVCRQLGLPFAAAEPLRLDAQQSQASVIGILALRCPQGNPMPTLQSCNMTLGGPMRCSSSTVAGVRCTDPSVSPPPPSPPQLPRPPRHLPSSPTATCRVALVGNWAEKQIVVEILQADIRCSASGGALVNVTVGRRLLSYAGAWEGVLVSQRPGDEEWGITFNDVPYIRLQDSVVRDLPHSRRALLQFSNSTKLEMDNVTITGLRYPSEGSAGAGGGDSSSTTPPIYHGPVHATNLLFASLRRFNCSNVLGAQGWACILLQYDTARYGSNGGGGDEDNAAAASTRTPTPQLNLSDCTFQGNNVFARGLYDTSYRQLALLRDKPLDVYRIGLGSVVVAPMKVPQYNAQAEFAPGGMYGTPVSVSMINVNATDNSGGLGAVFAAVNLTLGNLLVSGSSFQRNQAFGPGGVFAIVGGGPVASLIVTGASRFLDNQARYGNGAAVFLAKGATSLTITGNSSFSYNYACAGSGGAFHSNAWVGSILLSGGSSFIENTAAKNGGVFALGNGVGNIIITGESFMYGNQAESWVDKYVGGVFWIGGNDNNIGGFAAGDILLDEGASIMRNFAFYGGAIAVEGGLGRLTLRGGASLLESFASLDGGAVAVLSGNVGSVVIAGTSTMFAANNAQNGNGGALHIASGSLDHFEIDGGSSVEKNVAAKGGGAIWVSGNLRSVLLHDGGRMYDNVAYNGSGGAIWVAGNLGGSGSGGLMLSRGALMHGNQAPSGAGGAVAVGGSLEALSLWYDSVMYNNSAVSDGGAVWVGGSLRNAVLSNGGQMYNNTALKGSGGAVWVAGSLGGSGGAGLMLIRGAQLYGNKAIGGAGGAVGVRGDLSALLLTDNSSVYGNSATSDGGGVWVGGSLSVLRLNASSSAAENRARGSGGFLFAGGSGAAIDAWIGTGSSLVGNMAGEHGGGMVIKAPYGSFVLANGGTLARNVAELGDGGALYLTPADSSIGVMYLNVSGANLTSNTAGGSGGAIYLGPRPVPPLRSPPPSPRDRWEVTTRPLELEDAALWSLSVSGAVLQWNRAGGAGGAVLAAAGAKAALYVRIVDSLLDGNQAGSGDGVAAAAAAAAMAVTGVSRAAAAAAVARAATGGGAVAVTGLARDGDVWVPLSPPPAAGGAPGDADEDAVAAVLYDDWARVAGMCRLVVQASTLTNNDATTASGGALLLQLCTATVEESNFAGNTAASSGGAVAAAANRVPNISEIRGLNGPWWFALRVRKSAFDGNTARQGDGGAVVAATGGVVGLYDSRITGNRAGFGGGGVAVLPPTVAAAAGASYGAGLEMVSCRIDSNRAGEHGGGALAGALTAVRLVSSSLYDNIAGGHGGGVAVAAASPNLGQGIEPMPRAAQTPPPQQQQQQLQQSSLDLSRLGQQRLPLELEVTDTFLDANSALQGDGGGLFLSAQVSAAALRRLAFPGNTAGRRGAAAAAVTGSYDWPRGMRLSYEEVLPSVDDCADGSYYTDGYFVFSRVRDDQSAVVAVALTKAATMMPTAAATAAATAVAAIDIHESGNNSDAGNDISGSYNSSYSSSDDRSNSSNGSSGSSNGSSGSSNDSGDGSSGARR